MSVEFANAFIREAPLSCGGSSIDEIIQQRPVAQSTMHEDEGPV